MNSDIKHIREEFNKWLFKIENPILTESIDSKSQDKARSLLVQRLGYSKEEAHEFVHTTLRNDLPILRDKRVAKFTLGVTRMFCDNQINNARVINSLNSTLKLVSSDAHYAEYDMNLNGLSANELIDRFASAMAKELDNDKEQINQMQYNGQSQYDIVPIDSFEEASKYSSYVSWCITQYKNMFDSYTNGGVNQFYFCLRKDFQSVQEEIGENAPLDNYGLSMIAVCVDPKGHLATCTCRWNHDNGGNDSIMNTKQISQIINQNFYNVFKPNDKFAIEMEKMNQMLANPQMDMYNIFWSYQPIHELGIGVAKPRMSKNSFVLVDINNRKLLCNGEFFKYIKANKDITRTKWLPYFIIRRQNDDANVVDCQGNYIFDKDWYDVADVIGPSNGDSIVMLQTEEGLTEGWYYLYSIKQGKMLRNIQVREEGMGSAIGDDVYEMFEDEKGYTWALLENGDFITQDEMYERYSNNDEDYYDDAYN